MPSHKRKSGRSNWYAIALGRVLLLLLTTDTVAVQAAPPRARRPQFPPEVQDVFFPDAREKLVGERPTAPAPSAKLADNKPPAPAATAPATADTSGQGWSALISAEAVEDEIKARQPRLAAAVENPVRFKSGDYQAARRELGQLAALFAIVAQYDGRIRWQSGAASMRDQLARAEANCKVASDAAYNDARSRAEDVQTLIRGGSLPADSAASEVSWPEVIDRPLLMQRLEELQTERIAPAVSDAKSFERESETVLHEAQVAAALAEIITREGYEFADDDTYLEHARAMQQQALLLRAAVREGAYERARAAAGQLRQSCTDCHAGYRS